MKINQLEDYFVGEMNENMENYLKGEYSSCLEGLSRAYKVIFSFYEEELELEKPECISRLRMEEYRYHV